MITNANRIKQYFQLLENDVLAEAKHIKARIRCMINGRLQPRRLGLGGQHLTIVGSTRLQPRLIPAGPSSPPGLNVRIDLDYVVFFFLGTDNRIFISLEMPGRITDSATIASHIYHLLLEAWREYPVTVFQHPCVNDMAGFRV